MNKKHYPIGSKVLVFSGREIIRDAIEKCEWDHDQWTYLVKGEWYCQSEVSWEPFKNRAKAGESTLCRYTDTGQEIKEGDILGWGSNYGTVVLYNIFEGRFDAIEFADENPENNRAYELTAFTVPWKVLGNLDNDGALLLEHIPNHFNYTEYLSPYYPEQNHG